MLGITQSSAMLAIITVADPSAIALWGYSLRSDTLVNVDGYGGRGAGARVRAADGLYVMRDRRGVRSTELAGAAHFREPDWHAVALN
jgi:hypothetical protein